MIRVRSSSLAKTTFCLLAFLFVGNQFVCADDAEPNPEVVELRAVIREVRPNFFQADVRPKLLRVGVDYILDLELVNSNPNTQVSLKNPDATCGCVSATVDREFIPAGGSTRVRLRVKAPLTAKSNSWHQTVTFASEGNAATTTTFKLYVKATLSGVLAFDLAIPTITLIVNEGSENEQDDRGARDVKILHSAPVTFDSLALRGSQEINLFRVELIPDGDEVSTLRLSVRGDSVPEHGISSALIVYDKKTNRSIELALSAISRTKIDVLPSLIRLNVDPETNAVTGKILLINRALMRDADSNEVQPSVEALFGGLPMKTSVQVIRPGTARVEVSHTPSNEQKKERLKEILANKKAKISWTILWGKERVTLDSTVLSK